MQYIVFNGPPGSGKSTASKMLGNALLVQSRVTLRYDSFAAPMKHFIAVTLGERYSEMNKEKKRPELNGYSVREFLIALSETHIKPRYGKDFFGKTLVHRVIGNKPVHYTLIDDSGFDEEMQALPNDRYLIRIRRPNHDFSNDSRRYLPDVNFLINNTGDLNQLMSRIDAIATQILKGERNDTGRT